MGPAGEPVTLSRRDSELLVFDQLYRAAAGGDGAVLLINGPVGAGKTALLRAMASRAGRQGGWCFMITGSARERGHPFGVLDRLIQSMCAAGMEEPFPDGMDGGANLFAMMDRVGAAIRDLARARPVVVGIDDAHFADERSLRCLSVLIPRIESSGVVMVLNESSSYERDMADLRAETLHLPFCHQIRLAPLTSADIAVQLQERLGTAPDEDFVRFCAEVSGGIPVLLHALIDDGAAAPGSAAREPGVSYQQAVLCSLRRCAPSTAAVAQAIAVLGDNPASGLIAELSGVDVTLVEESIRDLHEMGLLGNEWFRDPHTRSAVLAGIPLPTLPGLHSRAAELLHDSGAPTMAVAGHLIAAQDGGKATWRVAILCEAAREAMVAGDVDSAVSHLRHAVGASPDETQRARTGVLLAEAQWHADPSRAVRPLNELGRDVRAGLLTGSDILIAVNQLLWWGEFAEADELLRLGDAEESGDSLAQLWAFFCQAGRGPEPCEEPGRPADSPLVHSGLMAAVTHLSSAASLVFDGMKTDRADQMLLGVPAGRPLTPALDALVVLVQTGRLDEAVAWCDRLLKEDWISRVPMRKVMIETVKSVAAVRGGDSETALHCIREVFETVPPPAWGVVAGLPLSVAVRASIDLGDAHSARAYLTVPVPPAMLDTPFAVPYLLALGRFQQAMDHPESATMYSRWCVELMKRWGVDTAAAAAALAEFDMPRPLPPATEETAGVGTRGLSGTGATAQARQAAMGASLDSGKGEDLGEWGAGGEPAGLAAPDVEAGAKLTVAERRVVALAAAGNTNREIAERLFITVSTVEQHLTKVYRKLKVSNRSGLQRYRH